MAEGLNTPHGGTLVNLLAGKERARALEAEAGSLPGWTVTPRQRCDLEMLLNGSFSPLRGFLGRHDYDAVRDGLRLADGALWPIPVTLDLPEEVARGLGTGARLALRDAGGEPLAVLTVSDVWRPDREAEARAVFGTASPEHPAVKHLLSVAHPMYVGGSLEGIRLPGHADFPELRATPAELRAAFAALGWTRVVAFQTRNPLHRAHVELTVRAAREAAANLLIHPVVGMTKPGDVDHVTRVKCYQAVLPQYPSGSAKLALLPLAMRMGGPREAVWHAIIRKNHGVTHFIVGRDHAGPGKDSSGKPFYGPYDAQTLLRAHEQELGVAMVEFKMMVYLPDDDRYVPEDQVPPGKSPLNISGTELRKMLVEKRDIPAWFTFPAVAAILRDSPPPGEG